MLVKKTNKVKPTKKPKPSTVQLLKPQPYKPDMKQLAQAVGKMLGGSFGGPVGANIGGIAAGAISRISGFGDYTVRSNSLTTMGATTADSCPAFTRGDNTVRIRHREYITDLVSAGTGFNSTQYVLNPGNPGMFPWLSSIAGQFQEYSLHGAVVTFKSTSSEYASGAGLGAVVIASNYNAADYPYQTKIDMENTEFCVSTKPSLSIIHPIECDPRQSSQRIKFTRDVGQPVSDVNLYDWCNTTVATSGLSAPSGVSIGELWITYDIEFFKPVSATAFSSQGLTQAAQSSTFAHFTSPFMYPASDVGSTVACLAPQSYTLVIDSSNLGNVSPQVGWINTATSAVTFTRPGRYRLLFSATGTGTYGTLASTNAPWSWVITGGGTINATVFSWSAVGDTFVTEIEFVIPTAGIVATSTRYSGWTTASSCWSIFTVIA
jgi:hypothetical protein